MTEDSIARATAQGRANQANFRLVENWCAHIRIQRSGGIGMVEQMTGVPIGHFGPACDHAGPDGMMSWDIRDAAVDFYDRHCGTCTVRQPVREPNLSQWVKERDIQQADAEAQEAAAVQAETDALEARREQRRQLRLGLSPTALNVVDQLDDLDVQPTPDLVLKFTETARLAPEAFPDTVREHLFTVLDAGEVWAQEAALGALSAVGADPGRLARAAAAALQRGAGGPTAVRVFMRNRAATAPADVAKVLPVFIELSAPEREPFTTMQRPRQAPLVLLSRSFPTEVTQQIQALLDQATPAGVSAAARAIEALARPAHGTVKAFARELVSTLVRAQWIPPADDLGQDAAAAAARDLSDAVIELFRRDPATVDDLLQKFFNGASGDGETRIFRVYREVLSLRGFRDERPIGTAERVAFGRQFREAPKSRNWKLLSEIVQGIPERPERLLGLAQEHADELLGTAIMMDERLIAFDAEPNPDNLLETMERGNHRTTLHQLRGRFAAWAAAGFAVTGDHAAYVKVLENIPETRDGFAGSMIENAVGLAKDTAGLNAILPSLYSSLVGASTVRRGAAVKAVGRIPSNLRRHAPDLLFEAFVPALTDPYVYVHKSALSALRGLRLPKAFDERVRVALGNLVVHYGREGKDYDVVREGIEILVGRYLSDEECAGRTGTYLVGLLAKLPKWSLTSHVRFLAQKLGRADGFVDLLLSLLTDPEASSNATETILDTLADLPNEVLAANRAALAAVSAGVSWETRRRVHGLVELLTRAGAWAAAVQVAEQAVAEIPDTKRERPQRRLMELAAAAARYELALASGDSAGAAAAAEHWRAMQTEIEQARNAA